VQPLVAGATSRSSELSRNGRTGMSQTEGRIIAELMERLIAHGPEQG
jgi:hypothetical protein